MIYIAALSAPRTIDMIATPTPTPTPSSEGPKAKELALVGRKNLLLVICPESVPGKKKKEAMT
jgi:hypothetical protein